VADIDGGMIGRIGVVATAERLADEVLLPAALETDRAGAVPRANLDALAAAGLYGLAGPVEAGGLDADLPTTCAVLERLASGCLTTAFVWLQHLGAVRAAAASANPAMAQEVGPLCRGDVRAGLALGGALPGPPRLRATETDGGWLVTGTSPFVSGWGLVDLLHVAARTADGRLVWALVDAVESDALAVQRLELAALDATATVRADFRDHPVAAARVTSVAPYVEGPPPPELMRVHAALPLGVARRCCALLGPSPLDDELARLRTALDALDPERTAALRGAAGELAFRAAGALAVRAGSRSLLASEHGQRLAREALFCLVYALRPDSADAALSRLGARARAPERADS
jgi:Acyl-CoA dehydrogenase, N-terminal domain